MNILHKILSDTAIKGGKRHKFSCSSDVIFQLKLQADEYAKFAAAYSSKLTRTKNNIVKI